MNELKLDFQEAIIRLREKGWSRPAIARELGIHRETVGRYLRLSAKPATELPAGSASVPSGSRSRSARWEEKILAKLDSGFVGTADLSGPGHGGSVPGRL